MYRCPWCGGFNIYPIDVEHAYCYNCHHRTDKYEAMKCYDKWSIEFHKQAKMKDKNLQLQQKIDSLKCQLYSVLLQKPYKELTDNETDIMFQLSQDTAVQNVLKNIFKNKGD
jgi:capsule polysaccharide modification protein KpsS